MFINKHRFHFNFWRRFFGTSLFLFLASLSQDILESAQVFIAVALCIGLFSAAAIFAATRDSGVLKFLWSLGFIILVGVLVSFLLIGSCYFNAFDFCSSRPFRATITSYFLFPILGLLLYILISFLRSFSKKGYHA
jgi:hypothetical protein